MERAIPSGSSAPRRRRRLYGPSREDLPIQGDDPFAAIVAAGEKNFIAGYMDGSVRVIPREVQTKTLRALLSINGSELIDDEALK